MTNKQAPSATVDLPAIKTLFVKWCNAKTEDTHSNAMTLNAFAVAVAELLHSQQPTADVDLVESICNFVNENYAYIADERGSKMPLELFLQEALIGTYTEKELLRNRISELESENVRLIKIMDGR